MPQRLECFPTEAALPEGTPARVGSGRAPWDVLADHLAIRDVRAALRSVAAGAGGELRPTKAGNVPFCSAESSALMAVNFLAPFASRGGLLGAGPGSLTFERELRVTGVRSRVGPTLDALFETDSETLAIEVKTAEPWRGAPRVSISSQYVGPAARVSDGTLALLEALRSGRPRYQCLDAAQLLKHLLGIHSALAAGLLRRPASLTLLYWRPSIAGRYEAMFDVLERELSDFASRVSDQAVRVLARSTSSLIAEWASAGSSQWLADHARVLRARYDVPLRSSPRPGGRR